MTTQYSQAVLIAEQLGKTVSSGEKPLQILDNINLEVQSGESLAIVGVSGSGKSTLLGLLAGLDLPTTGQIFINQQNITTLNEDGRASLRAKYIGFIFQSFHLLPSLTALENVMLPLELSAAEHSDDKAKQWLDRVGLTPRLHHYPNQLSGGEQQRVAIARAFATNPSILLADEPTGNLDKETGAKIIELLFSLNVEQQTTLVLVTHDENLAERCQRRFRLKA